MVNYTEESSIKLQLFKQSVNYNYSYVKLNPTNLGTDRRHSYNIFSHNELTNDYLAIEVTEYHCVGIRRMTSCTNEKSAQRRRKHCVLAVVRRR